MRAPFALGIKTLIVRVLEKEDTMADVSIGYQGRAVVLVRVEGFKSYQVSRAIRSLPDATIWWEPRDSSEDTTELFSEGFDLEIALDSGGVERTLEILKGIASETYEQARACLGGLKERR